MAELLLPPRASHILQPGLRGREPGVEHHLVPGRGTLVVAVEAGDRLELTDLEGGQACELLLAGADGHFDAGGLGPGRAVEASGFLALMAEDAPGAQRTRDALRRRGIDLAQARGLRLFGAESPPGRQASFVAGRDGLLVVVAPAPRLAVDEGATATPLRLCIQRQRVAPGGMPALPEPLADPLLEHRITPGTATAYVVRAGEFIQVLDVAGRQCSDFQAFSLRKIEQGRDGALDATVTRTLLGRAYPLPGLPSKAFDRDFEPLVEVVQDTCGRHDAFATACSARYYEDMGYPGHANCSDNFNRALHPWGVPARKGWEALNLFYNTSLDAQHRLLLDEPWSRPGDYVLLRALTDLVCVSSSCPDDIDPANGWNPTDIHVRTYAATQRFSRAVAHRMMPDAEPRLTRESAFHARTAALTRDFADYHGFWLPQQYAGHGPIAEYWACREAVVVMDLSALRKFEVTGPDAEALLQWCMTRDVRKLAVGQVVYTAVCRDSGAMIDDGTLMRLGAHNFRLVCGEDFTGEWLRQQAQTQGYRAWVRSSTDQLHNLAVQGPRSRELLQSIVWCTPDRPQLGELGWFRFTPARIGGPQGPAIVLSRTGYTGELGYEIFCHPQDALAVFDAVWAAGQPLGLCPMGLAALDMVRIEAGLAFAGQEFDGDTDPFEAGIGFTVPLKSKDADFVGRVALQERQAHPRRVLVGLEIDACEAVGHGDCVHLGRAQVGVVTSAVRSPLLQKTIALARLEVLHAAPGTELEIGKLDGHQKRLPARVVRFPHFDPDKTRVRG